MGERTLGHGRGIGRRRMLGATLAGLAGVGVAEPVTSHAAAVQELPNELIVVSRSGRVEYHLEVSGRLELGDESGENEEIENGNTVDGVIDGTGRDNYHFSGDIVAFEITTGAGNARVVLDGEEVDPEELGTGDAEDGGEFPHELALRARSGTVEYRVGLDGRFESAGGEEDVVSGQLAEGEEVTYSYFGPVVTVDVTAGIAAFSVVRGPGGTSIREDSEEDPLPNRIRIFGLGDTSRYRFSVTGSVVFGEQAEEEPTSIPADRQVDDSTIEGHVHAHDGVPMADDYYFSGDVDVERAAAPVRMKLKW